MVTSELAKYCELLATYSEDIIWVLDKDFRMLFISESVERLSGFTVDEVLSLPFETFYTPESVGLVISNFKRITEEAKKKKKKKTASERVELQAYNKDGSIDWIEVQTSIIFDENMDVDCIIGITRKITDRKEQEKNRIDFIRALVHELKSPLTAIKASGQLQLEIGQSDNMKRLAMNVVRGAEQINKRTDELMELARGEQHLLTLHKREIDLIQLLKHISEEMNQAFIEKGIAFITDIPDTLPSIYIDDSRIRQVIQNLLNNAIKYTPVGGKVILRAVQENNDVVIEVEDTGTGISIKHQSTIFDPYVLKIAEGEQVKGLGLGLALARTFVELHDGKIWVESKLGKGSTFSFSIPIRDSR